MREVDVICCSMCIHLCICKGGEMSHFNITQPVVIVQQCGIFKNMFPVLVTSGNVLHLMITYIWIHLGVCMMFHTPNVAELQ